MSDIKKLKIIVIDKEEEMGLRIREVFEGIVKYNFSVKYYSSLVIDEIKGAYCVIIDSRLVKDVKNLIDVLNALSVRKIIIATNELNHPISTTAIVMGSSVFYRHSPVTTLLPKVIDDFQPQRMNKPTQPSTSTPNNNITLTQKTASSTNAKHFESDRQKFVLFYAPKGGVGKTSLIMNSAIQLAMKNLKVLVIDYSLFGSIRIKLKIDIHNPGLTSIIPAVKANIPTHEFEEIVKKNIYSYRFGEGHSFDVLSSDNPVSMANLSVETIEYINNVVHSLQYDVVLIDSASSLSKANMALFEICRDIMIVAAPDIASTWALIQHKEIMHNLHLISRCKLVFNMFAEQYGFLPAEIETELQYPLVAVIPENQNIKIQENSGNFISFNSQDPFNIYYKQLAHNIIPVFGVDDITVQKKKFGFDFFKKGK